MIENVLFGLAFLFVIASVCFAIIFHLVGGYFKKIYSFAIFIPTIAALSYWAMIAGYKIDIFTQENITDIRFLDWLLTTPLLVTILCLLPVPKHAKKPILNIALVVALDVIMIVTGYFASHEQGEARMWLFLLSLLSFVLLLCVLIYTIFIKTSQVSAELTTLVRRLLLFTAFIWTMYPLVWLAVYEAPNKLSFGMDLLLFGVLDFFSKICFISLMLFTFRKIHKEETKEITSLL
jgi:bacteriorhodopsin